MLDAHDVVVYRYVMKSMTPRKNSEGKPPQRLLTERLKAILDLRGLNGAQVADAIGITRAAMSYLMTGKRQPGRQVLAALADKLTVTENFLLGVTAEVDIPELMRNPSIVELLGIYQGLTVHEQERALQMIRLMRETAEPASTHAGAEDYSGEAGATGADPEGLKV